ncbi:MAG: DUF2851 family protein [Bacteroidota bacterium]
MSENFLHFIWKTHKLPTNNIFTTNGEQVLVLQPGLHNIKEGPDFFNALLEIDGQQWAGNVEIHLKTSDWYAHGHEQDVNYDNVVLHVVWEEDTPVFRKDGSEIPTVELKHIVSAKLLKGYQSLFTHFGKAFINCENDLQKVDPSILQDWEERLFFERLEEKSIQIFELLQVSKNDWEKVLFCMLMKNFGLNTNGLVFLKAAMTIDFSIIRKLQYNPILLEALLLGSVGLLSSSDDDDLYRARLQREFDFLRKKFNLSRLKFLERPKFYGIRPHNFPTIRLAQLAQLYSGRHGLFQEVINVKNRTSYYRLFEVVAGKYWDNHYVFGKVSKSHKKRLNKRFIDLIITNTVIPLRFCYAKKTGNGLEDTLVTTMLNIPKERNVVIDRFEHAGWSTTNALQSQSKLQLHANYCTKQKCLQCSVGTFLLGRNL